MGSLFGKTPKPEPIQLPPPPEIQAPSTLADPAKQARRGIVAASTMLTGPRGLSTPRANSGNTLLGQ